MSKNNEIGSIGELSACEYLITLGFEIVDRNVRYRYGEIDIVAREIKKGRYIWHFVEVKSVAREKRALTYHPLQNISREKMIKQKRAVQAYLMGNTSISIWQYDALCVYAPGSRSECVDFFPNQIL